MRDGFTAAMIHGDRSQSQRNGALSGFQEGRFQVLVATDIASRGLHVDDVAHVINYDLPKMAEDFIHRVGRTGRAGAQGRASTLVAGAEVLELRHIERTLKLRIERKQMDIRRRSAKADCSKHAGVADVNGVAGRGFRVAGERERPPCPSRNRRDKYRAPSRIKMNRKGGLAL